MPKETKPHHGVDVLPGCCLAFLTSLVLPFTEGAGHLAQMAFWWQTSHISSHVQRGKESWEGKPRRADFPLLPTDT